MNSANQVTVLINDWKSQGMTKSEIVIKTAEACMGWSYVWGAYGQLCTPAHRLQYANRTSCPSGESDQIIKKCQSLSGKGTCSGCKWFPGGEKTRDFDCRVFTRWVLQQVGITLQGAGATSQYNTNSNWTEKGLIADMPTDKICCVFYDKNGTKEHTGLYVGDGQIIHCSGTVKRDTTANKRWTHYAIPKGLDGDIPMPDKKPTLRKGSKGEYVTLLQTKLIQLGYDLSPYGADGSFGNKTLEAVKKFQSDMGLNADGVVGEKTWEALDNGKVSLYTVTINHVSKTVADEIVGKFGGTMVLEEG